MVKRGARPEGGGEVVLRCPIVKALKPINLTSMAQVRRVRGVAYAAKVLPHPYPPVFWACLTVD